MQLDLKNSSPEYIDKVRNDYKNYSGLIFNDETLYNPLLNIPKELEDNPHLYYTWLLSRPEYIHFFCSEFLNVHLLPFQCVIIQELWNRKFPMLIASRGASKSFCLAVYAMLRATLLPDRKIVVVGAAFRQSKLIYEYCTQIWNNAPLLRDALSAYSGHQGPKGGTDSVYMYLGSSKVTFIPVGSGETIRGLRANDVISDEFKCVAKDTLVQTEQGLMEIKDYLNGNVQYLINKDGQLEMPDHIYKTPDVTDVYKVTTENGYSFKCSIKHKFMTVNGWKTVKEANIKDWIKLDTNNYFPERYITKDNITVNESIGWLFGASISEGTNTNRNYLSITSTDIDYINKVKESYKDVDWIISKKDAYKDNRGWDCKECWVIKFSNTKLRESFYDLGLDYVTSHKKTIPWSILQSPKSVIIQFLKGLFEGDGSCFEYTEKSSGKKRIGIAYYSVCEKLIDQLQILLLKFNIKSSKTKRRSNISKNDQWMLSIRSSFCKDLKEILDIEKFNNKIQDFSFQEYKPSIRVAKNKKGVDKYYVSTCRMNKNIHIGTFLNEQDCLSAFDKYQEENKIYVKIKKIEILPQREVLYDFHLPITHSFIGNGFVQHNSLNQEIFENVIAGFASVESSPQEKVANRFEKDFNDIIGLDTYERKDDRNISNQIVISGTAYYHFNHFAQYWDKWHQIIMSKGDPKKLEEIFPNGIEEGFDWKDYSIIRLPYDILPKSYMDSGNIARSRATLNKGLFEMEFLGIFSKDSDGFFKASLIESCVASERNQIEKSSGIVNFFPRLSGDHDKKYYMGVDTASQVDNFAITILEAHNDHRRVVYCWTTNTNEFKKARKSGEIAETDFFKYCSGKIRELLSRFQIEKISIDSQGGGRTIYESLHDKSSLKPGEQMIWEAIIPGKLQETDSEEGLHIIEMVNFRKQEYTSGANHGLKKDFEDKKCLFPEYNPAILASYSGLEGKFAEQMEDNIINIEELKRELTLIVVTSTPNGNERFDTPENKIAGTEKGAYKKDRYSALIMANMAARQDYHNENDYSSRSIEQIANRSLETSEANFIGPSWIVNKLNDLY